ncbi:hypothetical protein AB0D97_32225 [Streptomyces roseus]|uniref:hypothetical protein n=1 Tax=Streptomyces roseus TaxID=66430 RepID=UPI0033ECB6A9
METACAQGWVERGLGLDCDQCRLHSFIPLHATGGRAVSPACSAPALYLRANNNKAVEVVHRRTAFIDRAVDNGVLRHLLVIAALQDIAPSTYLLPASTCTSETTTGSRKSTGSESTRAGSLQVK